MTLSAKSDCHIAHLKAASRRAGYIQPPGASVGAADLPQARAARVIAIRIIKRDILACFKRLLSMGLLRTSYDFC